MIHRECRLLQLPVLVGNGAACSLCVAILEELGQNGNDILRQFVGCSIIKYFAQFVGFVISPNVSFAAFTSCKVSVYLVRKHQHPQHTQWIVFPTGNSGTLTQESQMHRHTLFGS